MRTNLVSPGISFIYIVSQDPCRKQDGYFPYNRSIFSSCGLDRRMI